MCSTTQKMQGMNLMCLCAPLYKSYLQKWIKPPTIDHQNFMTLLLTTFMCAPNLDKSFT